MPFLAAAAVTRLKTNSLGPAEMFYFDPNDRDLKQHILAITPEPGYCFFIDIAGSTSLKQNQKFPAWAALIHNTFASLRGFLPAKARPLKLLGDGLLYFIPESELSSWGENALSLFYCLKPAAADPFGPSSPIRIGVVRGEAYGLTFFKNAPDFYGSDVDLAARLQALAPVGGLAINDAFHTELLRLEPNLSGIRGPISTTPKGFSSPTAYYCVDP